VEVLGSIFCFYSIPESGLTTLTDTATPVTIDNDASIRQTTNVKTSKPGILGYIKDKINEKVEPDSGIE
jgi:hypothetical protein